MKFAYCGLEPHKPRVNCTIKSGHTKVASMVYIENKYSTIIHSDRGCQFTSKEYKEMLLSNGITQSMSAPTSPVLLFLSHQEIFDKISKHMKRQGITMTLYMDDITLSAKRHISGKAVKYVEKTLSEHELRLNHDKIKRFGRDIGFVTGVAIKPSGKLEVPYKINYSVIEMLESKKVEVWWMLE